MATTTNGESLCRKCKEIVPSEHLYCRICGTVNKGEFEDLERGLPEYYKGRIYLYLACYRIF